MNFQKDPLQFVMILKYTKKILFQNQCKKCMKKYIYVYQL